MNETAKLSAKPSFLPSFLHMKKQDESRAGQGRVIYRQKLAFRSSI
jgi:hypothetical protein